MYGPIIQDVLLVDKLTRHHVGRFDSVSLPGHLIHVVTQGQVEQSASGMTQCFGPGNVIWYHDNELIHGRVLKAPWTFYTVNFRAPLLMPLPLDQRVCQLPGSLIQQMEQLLEAWCHVNESDIIRRLRVHSLLLDMLVQLLPAESQGMNLSMSTRLWWRIEAELRRDLAMSIDLTMMQRIARCSERTIIRTCHQATGLSPMKRVKSLRMSYGRGLLRYSTLSISGIALRLGYSRVQEFSRDYHRYFDSTPSQDRASRIPE